MKRSLRAVIVAAALAVGCGAGLPEPTSADASLAQAKWPGASLDDLHRGRQLYVATCAGCHALKTPAAVAPTEWSKEVAKMRKKRGVKLTDDEAELIVRYLWTVGSRAPSGPAPDRTAAR
jgi:cytochrome c5